VRVRGGGGGGGGNSPLVLRCSVGPTVGLLVFVDYIVVPAE